MTSSMARKDSVSPLLQLPDPCLLAVLRSCADDHRSLFSAARAHSRLHQAAVMAYSSISSITAVVYRHQLDSLVSTHLTTHGAHISNLSLKGAEGECIILHQLPDSLTQLSSLELVRVHPQMQRDGGYPGVLGAAAPLPLKQLRLKLCQVFDREEGLIAAFKRLPGLEHLSITDSTNLGGPALHIPLGKVLPGLQQLTYLELGGVWPATGWDIWAADEADYDSLDEEASSDEDAEPRPHPNTVQMQHLTVLTRLADLRLPWVTWDFTASMLSGVQTLTRLQLLPRPVIGLTVSFEPAALAGKTLLQHLELGFAALLQGARGAQLLSQLQHLQHLTCLMLHGESDRWAGGDARADEANPPAAAYSALTASSKLQHLDVSGTRVPAGACQHMFPAGRQLPHLRVLRICAGDVDGTRLVSCCPALRLLDVLGLQHSTQLLAPLQRLRSLRTLHVQLAKAAGSSEGLEGVLQLTGLRALDLSGVSGAAEALLLQLTQLRQLTSLDYKARSGGRGIFYSEPSSVEPVWRQVLQHHLNHPDPAVAQQAASALEQAEPVQ